MTHEKEPHLDKDQMIRAIVDDNDLPMHLREHLSRCESCRLERERFERQLSLLGHMAERLAPSPGKRVRLPEQESSTVGWFMMWRWRTLLATGVAAAMIMAAVWWIRPVTLVRFHGDVPLSLTVFPDEQFMTEVSWLEQHVLPSIYFDISGESVSGISEEFMDFVIPPIQNESVHHHHKKEGYYAA